MVGAGNKAMIKKPINEHQIVKRWIAVIISASFIPFLRGT
jgi:hypothetical protein